MKRNLRKIITRVIVFLLLGAIVNVAVAWGGWWFDANRHVYLEGPYTCGWPSLSLHTPDWGVPRIQWGIRYSPHLPIWPGFAINTVFYATVLWMIFAFPFVLRRRRRIKRNLCAACAYPVGTSPVCTECGGAVKRSAISSQKSEDVQS